MKKPRESTEREKKMKRREEEEKDKKKKKKEKKKKKKNRSPNGNMWSATGLLIVDQRAAPLLGRSQR